MILQKACLFLASLICISVFASQSEKTIVFYGKESCAPCRQEKLWLDSLGIKYVVGAGDQNAGIQFYPTLVILIDGKESFRIVGQKSKEELRKLLE